MPTGLLRALGPIGAHGGTLTMERIRTCITRRWPVLAAIVALAATGSAPTPALAQPPGFGPTTVTLRVVDQNGTVLNGSVVQLVGSDQQWVTPLEVTVDGGPNLFSYSPAFQGAMLPGGFALPTANNGLQRAEMVMVDGSSPTVDLVWQTAQVAVSVVDQNGAAIPGARWGFDGEGAFYAPGTVLAPIDDPSVYTDMSGPSVAGWHFAVQAAFGGAAADLFRADTREIDAPTSALSFEWRQVSCNMGVVDGTGAALRGATWSMLGHTFAEGDAITLPVTDAALYPSLSGSLAAGIPTQMFTNTSSGSGAGTFSVAADGSLAPAFVDVGGAPFGLRCGVSAPPPITTGTLAGTVTKDGAPFAGASLTVVDANAGSHAVTTDGAGGFTVTDVPQGTATVTLSVPAGTHAVDPASGQLTAQIVAEQTTHVAFSIATDPPPPPTTGSLAGVVTKDGLPFAGAGLSVVDAASATHLLVTDAAGTFTLSDLPQGTATATLGIPSGTHAVDPASGRLVATIVAEKTTNVSFSIATDAPPPPIVDNPETRDYWWHNAKAAQKGKGNHEESFADMRTNFPQAIFDQFANAATDPVRVEGVTQVDPDGPGGPLAPRPLNIDDVVAGLDPSHPSNLAEAKSELLVVLLNVVSNRLSLDLVVDAQGTTLAQEIRILAAMINDGAAANDVVARGRAHAINTGHLSYRLGASYGRREGSLDPGASSEVTPSTTALAPATMSLGVARQADASLSFAMTLPEAASVSLDVYDVTGRHVAQLWRGSAPAGTTSVSWAHPGLRPGMYFARMQSPSGVETAKALVAQ